MAEGQTIPDVVETRYRRYPKYPHWPLVQAAPVTGQPNTEYELSLNDSGNMLFITTNNNNGSNFHPREQEPHLNHMAKDQSSVHVNSLGHISPRKWHHGDFRKDLMPEYHVRQYNKNMQREDAGYGQAITNEQRGNTGQITIYYNGLDFVEGLTNGTETDKVNERELNSNRNEKITPYENKTETNYDQMKRDYLNKSRAKEMQYSWLKKNSTNESSENNAKAVIRYDIEIPAFSTMQQPNNYSQDVLTDNRILHKAQEDIKALKRETSEKSNPPSPTASMTLPKFGTKFPRNTRFGSQGKFTAYRPSTRLDNHRKKKLDDIMESQVTDVDLEEGRQLWAEVDAVTREPLVPSPLTHRRKGYKSRDIHTSNNSVEFFPLFDKESRKSKEIQNNLWYDDKDDILEPEVYGFGVRRNILDPSKSPKAINVGNYGRPRPRERFSLNEEEIRQDQIRDRRLNLEPSVRRFASVPLLQLHDENGNMAYIEQPQEIQGVRGNGKEHMVYSRHDSDSNEPYIHVPESGACKGAKPNMTTTLPRITPANTPLPPGVCQSNPPRSHSSASMYGAYPPKDLSSSADFLKIPGRINPLAPPPPRKRINWSWETTNQHWENDKRRILMQKREHTRYHSAWSKAFYGAPAEKEAYRRHFRDVLKQQMADRENSRREEMINKVKETERAVKYDEQCRSNDAQEYFRKHAYLMLYRDGNKQQMEDKWAERRYNKVTEDRVDRERLRYNPINWSCSLK